MSRCWLAAVLLVALAGCSKPDSAPMPAAAEGGALRKVTLQLNWYPEAEHGGFYAAQLNGYYKEEGLDVEIVEGGAEVPVTQRVATGQVDFGIENADQVLLMRAQDADLVAVMAPMQTSPRCLVVHESAGAKSFGDLARFTIAMNEGEPFAQFLMKGVLPQDVQVVPYGGGVAHFLSGPKNAQQGYSFSEPFLAKEQGGDPQVLLVAEAGFNPYTSCLITRGETAEEEADLVRRMVRASVRGWQEYLQDPKPTNAAIHKANEEMSLEALAFGAEALRPLCIPPGEENEPFGRMTVKRWGTLAEQMSAVGMKVDASMAFRTEIWPGEKPDE